MAKVAGTGWDIPFSLIEAVNFCIPITFVAWGKFGLLASLQ
jgi:hypothetical protein